MCAVFKRYGIETAVVVRRVNELQLRPCQSVVTAVGYAYVLAACACHGGKPSVFKCHYRRLYGKYAFVCLHIIGALPCLAHVIGVFKVQAPSAFLYACRCDEPSLAHYGLVLDRSEIIFFKRLASAPRLSAVLRAYHPACPVGNVRANLEVYLQLAARHLIYNRVPARLALIARGVLAYLRVENGTFVCRCCGAVKTGQSCKTRLFAACLEHAVGNELWRKPLVAALRLAAYPYTYVGVAFLCSAEICCNEVAFRCLCNSSRVAFGE